MTEYNRNLVFNHADRYIIDCAVPAAGCGIKAIRWGSRILPEKYGVAVEPAA